MQVKSANNPAPVELDVRKLSGTVVAKTELCFLYIGKNPKNIKFLSQAFSTGFTADSYDEAKKIFERPEATACDVILIDIPFVVPDLRLFEEFIKKDSGRSKIPVIYNEKQLINKSLAYLHNHFIDDVIDLNNWRHDFSDKVSFLKKVKDCGPVVTPSVPGIIIPSGSAMKRALDIAISLVLLVALTPLFLLIAIAIKLESKGPVFYNAKRAGRGFKIFRFHKFRTMEFNADKKIDALAHLNQYSAAKSGPSFFKITNDPRITRVGKLLRNTSLDELPQLFNVLKGEMSLVGNRPLPLYEAATLTTDECVERFMAPAGITGLWQIKKRGNSEMSVEERIRLDISYARKSNLLYDFWIMANTPTALFQKENV